VIITYFSYNSVVVCFCFLFVYHKYHSPFIRAVVIYAEKNEESMYFTRTLAFHSQIHFFVGLNRLNNPLNVVEV
jgi:hypothetical protein